MSESGPGFTVPELIATLTVLALAVGGAMVLLQPFQEPVVSAGDLLDGLIKQTRARAISSTTVHRVRPSSDHELVAETAATCSAVTWTDVPALAIEFPEEVTMDDTGWVACFDGRGIAADAAVIRLVHPRAPARTLELLRGGMTRWQ